MPAGTPARRRDGAACRGNAWVRADERLHPSAPAFNTGELNPQRRFFEEGRYKFKQTYLRILISFAYVRACKPVCKFCGLWIISELPLQLRSCFERAAPAAGPLLASALQPGWSSLAGESVPAVTAAALLFLCSTSCRDFKTILLINHATKGFFAAPAQQPRIVRPLATVAVLPPDSRTGVPSAATPLLRPHGSLLGSKNTTHG